MAALQATIPFKSRKKTSIKSKLGEENCDILNTESLSNGIKLKRRINETLACDFSSATKILKKDEESEDHKKNALQNSPKTPQPLTCRESEIEWLDNFLTKSLDTEESASLYISGPPGTGKTASLSYILGLPKVQEGFKQVYVNCTMMKSAASIYKRICKELQLKTSGTSEKVCLSAIEKYLSQKHKMILLVLDEIDQLDSKRQSVLYTLFEWAARRGAGLVLVGVANALDLPQRALPRLAARGPRRPATLHFAPYTKDQILSIFTRVLASEDNTNVFSPVALQMLAAKISAVSGDMRRALATGRRLVELARRSHFADHRSVDRLMADRSVTVELKQVLQVLNDVYGGSRKVETEVDEAFPMQQKLILCSLILMLTKGKNKDIALGKLHDVYKRVAAGRNIAPLDLSEMSDACALLEARGAVRVAAAGGAGGGARGRRLRLQWPEGELAAALRDKPLLHAVLADSACLPRA